MKLFKNAAAVFCLLSCTQANFVAPAAYSAEIKEVTPVSPALLVEKLLHEKECSDEELLEIEKNFNMIWRKFYAAKIKRQISSLNLDSQEVEEFKNSVVECLEFYGKNLKLRNSHFGYPANMPYRSPLVDFFKFIEKNGFLSNNCGDVNESGNYQMDSKKVERDILSLFAQKFGLEKYWGYITSGGSESNDWAIRTSFKKNPNGILYFCESAHYSIHKNSELFNREIIPQTSDVDESIDYSILLDKIERNYNETGAPANIILTWGTTKFGSCDDVKRITDFLIAKNIPYYLHVDAALFGGIPNNQNDAPIISDVPDLHIDSISISLHKYIGAPTVKSVLLSTNAPDGKHIDYIGQTDSTTSGSRDIMPFSTRQQVIDVLKYSDPDDYRKNVVLFVDLLQERGIPFIRNDKSNTFVIDAPSEEICKKYQLSCFKDKNGKEKAHIIIFPYQNPEIIKNLANDLKSQQI